MSQMDANKKILYYELVGTLFMTLLGSALHFTFKLSGNSPVVGSFSAVNESVWEHMKLAFWPSAFWLMITCIPLRRSVRNFFAARAAGTYLMVFAIPLMFYSYTLFISDNVAIDIAIFFLAVVLGQSLSYKMLTFKRLPKFAEGIAVIVLILLGVCFIVFTFYPPHSLLFQNPESGGYGIG